MIKKAIFKIIGMHCVSCPLNIDGELEDTKGIKSAKTNYARQECEVEFEEDKIQIEKIMKVVEIAGYQAQVKFISQLV